MQTEKAIIVRGVHIHFVRESVYMNLDRTAAMIDKQGIPVESLPRLMI